MEERLQKLIAQGRGISRRSAEKLIEDGLVTVNGETARLGDKADTDRDEIHIDGEKLRCLSEEKVYVMLNKPVGYVTTMRDEKGRKTVRDLVSDVPQHIYPVGRLDINSSGLLLMTNDGDFANRVCHPSFEKKKTYRVQVTGDTARALEILKKPMELDGSVLRVPDVRVAGRTPVTVLDITIHEGKNRQVRRMCEAAGLSVRSLTRVSIGRLRLGGLKKGEWRYLSPREAAELIEDSRGKRG